MTYIITITEFAILVAQLRDAQKNYFSTRTRSALAEAKRLEKRVDAVILDILGNAPVQEKFIEE